MKIYLIALTILFIQACKQESPKPPTKGPKEPAVCLTAESSQRSVQFQLRKLKSQGKIDQDDMEQLSQYSNYMDISSILDMLRGGNGGFDIASILGKFTGKSDGMFDITSLISSGGLTGGGQSPAADSQESTDTSESPSSDQDSMQEGLNEVQGESPIDSQDQTTDDQICG